ncbi:trypsin-like peptidase domain-containing protein [Chitinophaga sp. YIM B06452]|uniref:trypsin-like peptidase domain-containing protein n=1 Tax=Chitinophaga sp. YIM B06452 TaxID=3082158 RepID=UPI0031FEFA88
MFKRIGMIAGVLSCMAISAAGQNPQMYIDYPQLFTVILKKADSMLQTGFKPLTAADLEQMAAKLTDEAPPAGTIRTAAPGARLLRDEDIYERRKNSVLVIGRIWRSADASKNLHIDFLGTAFPISENGVCVTNYHVFKDILGDKKNADHRDGMYCVTTLGGEIYFADRLLAYSQNNDLAVFGVATRGARLSPIPPGRPAQVGAPVYCISHPQGFFYYFSKGMVASNVTVSSQQTAVGYNPQGKPPIRMEITADYGIGSSGAPILDQYGNLAGVVSSTVPVVANVQGENGVVFSQQQMIVKLTTPVKALRDLLGF